MKTQMVMIVARLLVYAGAAGTLVLIVAGCVRAVARGVDRGAYVEVLVVIPMWLLIAGWMLSPFAGALMLHRGRWRSPARGAILVVVALLLAGLGANSFLVTSTFVGGDPHPTADAVTVLVVPVLQWMVVGAAALALHRLSR